MRKDKSMGETFNFDYYYGIEAEQFSFYRVPRILIKDKKFKNLSSDAKLLYGLMLDRMSLSMKNGWLDADNRVYIYYTTESIMNDLSCAKATAIKVLAELDSKKGIGLVEKKRQGLGKPDIIYVKNFVTVGSDKKNRDTMEKYDSNEKKDKSDGEKYAHPQKYDSLIDENVTFLHPLGIENKTEITDFNMQSSESQDLEIKKFKNYTSRSSEIELQEVQNLDFRKFERRNYRSSEVEIQEVQELNPNYTNNNYTNKSYTEMSDNNLIYPIYQSDKRADGCDGLNESSAYISLIKENIEYDNLMQDKKWNDRELYEELFQIICEIVCVKRKSVRVAGENYPYELVKSKFLKLNSSHLMYVMDCMRKTVSKIGNIKAYMITALYNAGSTISHYYQQAVQHDMYGGGWQEAGTV